MTLIEAIKHCQDVAAVKCDECGKEHQQLAEWLTKLADYENVTPIDEKWLIANKFQPINECVTYKKSYGKINLEAIFQGYGIWRISVFNTETSIQQAIDVCTKGQVKMFFGIYGMENLIIIN